MAAAEADDAVITLLDAVASPVALTVGVNLFRGPMQVPDATRPGLVVCVTSTGGGINSRMVGSTKDLRQTFVQVMVRADRSDYARGIQLARACRDALHCPTIPDGYCDVQVREPDPYYVSRQAEGRHVWAMNVMLLRST